MRLTKRQLKRIIREEYSRLKRRGLLREDDMSQMVDDMRLAGMKLPIDQEPEIIGYLEGLIGADPTEIRKAGYSIDESELGEARAWLAANPDPDLEDVLMQLGQSYMQQMNLESRRRRRTLSNRRY